MRKATVILADPPWEFRDKANAGKRGAAHKYPTMSLAELCLLPVHRLRRQDSLLAMWWVDSQPLEAIALAKAWGFTVRKMNGFVWYKRLMGKEHFGMGHYTRAAAECCLFATHGYAPVINNSVRQVIVAPAGKHSEKPHEARVRLQQLCGDMPRIELFARDKAPGWQSWGNEIDSDFELKVGYK